MKLHGGLIWGNTTPIIRKNQMEKPWNMKWKLDWIKVNRDSRSLNKYKHHIDVYST